MTALHTESYSVRRGIFLNFLSVLLNAVAMTLSKFALSALNPLAVTAVMSVLSALICGIYLQWCGIRFSLKEFRELLPVAVINGLAIVLLYSSIALLDPAVVGIVGRFYVVFTTILSWLVLRERTDRYEVSLIVLTFVGTGLFVFKPLEEDALHYLGISLGLLYTFFFAFANLMVKRTIHKSHSVSILFYNNLMASIACVVLLMVRGQMVGSFQEITLESLVYSLLTSAFTTYGLILFFNSFRFLSFKLTNLIRSTSPLFVLAISAPFFPIRLSPLNLFGGLMIIVTVLLLTGHEHRKRRKGDS